MSSNPTNSDSTLKHLEDLSPELRVSPQLKPLSIVERLKKSTHIDKVLRTDKKMLQKLQTEPKLLILGTSDSGKSTVLKQLKMLYCGDTTKIDIENSKLGIRTQMLATCRTILTYMTDQGEKIPEGTEELQDPKLVVDMEKSLDRVKLLIDRFWKNDDVRKSYKSLPSSKRLPETSSYFMNHAARIFDPAYKPTDEDWLKLRTITPNISETIIKVNNQNLHLFDVSGVKAHRKYWISYFDDVTSILFVASLSSYNEMMSEDVSTNKLMDSLVVFEHIVNNALFKKTGIILFLNKKDLFAKKIKKISIKEFFPEYEGKLSSRSSGADFIKQKFKKLAKREIVTHATCATDTTEMKAILNEVMLQISTKALQKSGLII